MTLNLINKQTALSLKIDTTLEHYKASFLWQIQTQIRTGGLLKMNRKFHQHHTFIQPCILPHNQPSQTKLTNKTIRPTNWPSQTKLTDKPLDQQTDWPTDQPTYKPIICIIRNRNTWWQNQTKGSQIRKS